MTFTGRSGRVVASKLWDSGTRAWRAPAAHADRAALDAGFLRQLATSVPDAGALAYAVLARAGRLDHRAESGLALTVN